MKKILLTLALVGLIVAPTVFGAIGEPGSGGTATSGIPQPSFVAWVNALARVIWILLIFAAIISIIIAGFTMATSHEDSKKVDQAKQVIFWAVIGIIVSSMAFGIVQWLVKKMGGTL